MWTLADYFFFLIKKNYAHEYKNNIEYEFYWIYKKHVNSLLSGEHIDSVKYAIF